MYRQHQRQKKHAAQQALKRPTALEHRGVQLRNQSESTRSRAGFKVARTVLLNLPFDIDHRARLGRGTLACWNSLLLIILYVSHGDHDACRPPFSFSFPWAVYYHTSGIHSVYLHLGIGPSSITPIHSSPISCSLLFHSLSQALTYSVPSFLPLATSCSHPLHQAYSHV